MGCSGKSDKEVDSERDLNKSCWMSKFEVYSGMKGKEVKRQSEKSCGRSRWSHELR